MKRCFSEASASNSSEAAHNVTAMIIMKDITIRGFRSIKSAELKDLSDFSVLAGLNNSGKSNFLRALNLFFTGKPEPDVPFELERNVYRGAKKSRKKKRIEIGVRFSLPTNFHFRQRLEDVEKLLGHKFKISKTWTLEQPEPDMYLNDNKKPLDADDTKKVEQFLSLVSFRYIPNRVIPTDIIKREQQALRDVLVRRLARFRKQTTTLFQGLQTTAESLAKTVSADVKNFIPDIDTVRLATASSLAELVFQFGYRLKEGNVETDETEQGSGLQSILMFETLHLIDRDYFQQFGWKQAAIWAVEEPESSLHTSLEARTASLLAKITHEEDGRLQIIGTTHSDLMMQYAERGFYIEKQNPGGKGSESIPSRKDRRDLVDVSARTGVSRWVSPLLLAPLDPLIIVEGKYDKDFLAKAIELKAGRKLNVCSLCDLTGDQDRGGIEDLKGFIKEHKEALMARPKEGKTLIIIDWDSAGKVPAFEKLVAGISSASVLAWNPNEANPKLTSRFRGIERFFPDRLIDALYREKPALFLTNAKGQYSVDPSEYEKVKTELNRKVNEGLLSGDLVYAAAMVQKIAMVLQ